mmetsp:Transcript_37694/g.45863  ORF Transcript_37694/g.45863 Transcript_37694/m.45863 type:complete len:181 (+) Transcript_37694:107-649(+)
MHSKKKKVGQQHLFVDTQETDTCPAVTTSDGGTRITMQGSRTAVKQASTLSIVALSVLFGLSSAGLTFVNKQVYVEFGKVCPMSLLMVQCLLNVVVCLALMTMREFNLASFSSLKKYGLIIPELNKLTTKVILGLQVGLASLFTVVIGQFATKYSPLPLFLAFRRSAVLASIAILYIVNG